MAEVTVTLRYLRQAPRKVRLVTDLIRGRTVVTALEQLTHLDRRAALPVQKLLASAVDAARRQGLDDAKLAITRVLTDQGPALKRRLINSRGRSSMIKKFTTHITLTVADRVQTKKGRS